MSTNFSHFETFSQSVKIEEELACVRHAYDQAVVAFRVDFRYEICWKNKSHEVPEEKKLGSEIKRLNKKELSDSSFKKIRNQLAKKLHPDVNPEMESMEEFKEMQEAFENGDRSKLIDSAVRHNIDFKVEESEISVIKKSIRKKEKKIEEMKNSIEWSWYISTRKNNIRKNAWNIMSIDVSPFRMWLSEQGVTIGALELESLARKKSGLTMAELLKSKVRPKDNSTAPSRSATRIKLLKA